MNIEPLDRMCAILQKSVIDLKRNKGIKLKY